MAKPSNQKGYGSPSGQNQPVPNWEDISALLRARVEARIAKFQPLPNGVPLTEDDPRGKVDLSECGLDSAAMVATVHHRLSRLRGIKAIDIGDNHVGDAGAWAVVERIDNLAQLHVRNCGVTSAGVPALLDSLEHHSPRLSDFTVSDNHLGDTGILQIAQRLCGLTTLGVRATHLTCQGAAKAIDTLAERSPRLVALDVGYNELGKQLLERIAEQFKELREIGLDATNFDGESMNVYGLIQTLALHLPGLVKLKVGWISCGISEMRVIAEELGELRSLDISGAGLSIDDAVMAIDMLAEGLPGLVELRATSKNLGYAGVLRIAERLQGLGKLYIGEASLRGGTATNMEKLIDTLAERSPELREFEVCSNDLGYAGVRRIAERLKGLQLLNISDTGLRYVAVAQLVEVVDTLAEHSPGLVDFRVSANRLGDAGVRRIAQRFQGLRKLHICNTGLTDEAALEVIDTLAERSPELVELNISRNCLGEAGVRRITQRLCGLITFDGKAVAEAESIKPQQSAPTLWKDVRTSIRHDFEARVARDNGDPQSDSITFRKGDHPNPMVAQAFMETLAEYAPRLPKLASLELTQSRITGEPLVAFMDKLADDPKRVFPALAKINLARCEIDGEAAACFVEQLAKHANRFPVLSSLSFSGNDMQRGRMEDGARAFMETLAKHALCFPHLDRLDLSVTNIGGVAAVAFIETLALNPLLRFPFLTTFNLRSIAEYGDDVEVFLEKLAKHADRFPALEELDLASNGIEDAQSVVRLIDHLRPGGHPGGSLRRIRVRGNPLRWPGMGAPIDEAELNEQDPIRLRNILLRFKKGDGTDQTRFGRVVLAGAGEAGKTTFLRFASQDPDAQRPINPGAPGRTIGFDTRRIEEVQDAGPGTTPQHAPGAPLQITLVDTGGQLAQMQSHCNLVYRNTRRAIFVLVLRYDQTYEQNRCDWYLQMLNDQHAWNRRTDTPSLTVVLTVTRGECIRDARKLMLPDPRELRAKFSHLNVELLDDALREPEGKHIYGTLENGEPKRREHPVGKARERILEVMRIQTGVATLVFKEKLEVERKLREHFELDAPPSDVLPRVPMMSVDQFKSWLAEQGVAEADMSSHVAYLDDALALMAPGLVRLDDRTQSEAEAGVMYQGPGTRDSWENVVEAIFNPRFLLGLLYRVSTDDQIRRNNGVMTTQRFRELLGAMRAGDRRLIRESSALERSLDRANSLKAMLDLLKQHLLVFEWQGPGEMEPVYLVPDQFAERTGCCGDRLGWNRDDLNAFVEVRCRQWLGENRLFRLMARFGHSGIEPIQRRHLTDEELAVARRDRSEHLGIWRNEVVLKQGDCRALVQTDVFSGRIVIRLKGEDVKARDLFLGEIRGTLLEGWDQGPDYEFKMAIGESSTATEVIGAQRRPAGGEGDAADRIVASGGAEGGVPKAQIHQTGNTKTDERRYIFRQVAKQRWQVAFDSAAAAEISVSSQSAGLLYLARLLAQPNRAMADVDLRANGDPGLTAASQTFGDDEAADDKTIQALEKRLAELEDSGGSGDDPAARLEETEEIRKYLKNAKGYRKQAAPLGNTPRKNAQNGIDRAIGRALKVLEENGQTALVDHLRSHIVKIPTYSRCYQCDSPPAWEVSHALAAAARPILPRD